MSTLFAVPNACDMLSIVFSLVVAAGCSDSGRDGSNDAAPDEEGGGGSRGDGPSPPAAQGAVSIHVSDPSQPTDRCAAGRHWANAPSPAVLTQQVTADVVTAMAVDGKGSSAVKCRVKSNGSTFAFSAEIVSSATGSGESIAPTRVLLGANEIKSDESGLRGWLLLQDDRTATEYKDDACSFSVKPLGTSEQLGVHPGRIWGSVECPRLVDPKTPGVACSVDAGFFIFENCEQ